jgi:hypothetical protein
VVVAAQQSTFIFSKGSQAIRFTVSFFHHHAIGDGLSGGAFHLTLLDALNIILADRSTINPSPLVRIPLLSLLPTIEMGTPLPVSFFFALKKIFQAYIYNPIRVVRAAHFRLHSQATDLQLEHFISHKSCCE